MTTELKECPFCGHHAQILSSSEMGLMAQCFAEECAGHGWRSIKKWNTRAPSTLATQLEALARDFENKATEFNKSGEVADLLYCTTYFRLSEAFTHCAAQLRALLGKE